MDHDYVPLESSFTDLSDAIIEPPDWVIENLLPPGLVFVAGGPKSLKSTLTAAMAALVAGFKCEALPADLSTVKHGGPVMMFSYEATAGELKDMLESGMRTPVKPGSIFVCDDPFAYRLDDEGSTDQLLSWLRAKDPRLVVLDPLRDLHSLDEKDSGDMNRLLRPLRKWAVEAKSSLVIVHHARKLTEGKTIATPEDIRGSSAIFGKADGVLVLTRRDMNTAMVNIHAVFKRARGWERTIELAAYGGEAARDRIGDVDKLVWNLAKEGTGAVDIAGQIHISTQEVHERVAKLKRAGLLPATDGGRKELT